MPDNKRRSRSTSHAGHGPPLKQLKPVRSTSNSDVRLENDHQAKRMGRTLATLRTSISQTEATAIKYRGLRTQTEGMLAQVTTVLEKQLEISKETVERLQQDLETLIATTNASLEAQAAAEVTLTRLRSTSSQHVAELIAKVQRESAREKLLSEEKISTLNKELKRMKWLEQRAFLLAGQRQELASRVQEYESIKTGVTPAALKDEYHRLIRENQDLKSQLEALKGGRNAAETQDVEKILTDIVKKVEESDSNPNESPLSGDDSEDDPSDEGSEDNEDDFKAVLDAKSQVDSSDLRLPFGRYYILVSDRRYFEIDWETECEFVGKCEGFRCKKCLMQRRSLETMKNHIWCKHYGGAFKCAYCGDCPQQYCWKSSVRRHILVKHSRY